MSAADVLDFQEFKRIVRSPEIFKHLFRYRSACQLHKRAETVTKPFLTALALRLMSYGPVSFEGDDGNIRQVTLPELFRLARGFVRDYLSSPELLLGTRLTLSKLAIDTPAPKLDLSRSPVYLRTDLVFDLEAGGSVGHIAGVLNNLDSFTGRPIFLTTDLVPTVRADIEVHVIPPEERFWDFNSLPVLFYNRTCLAQAARLVGDRPLSFVYQRYSLFNYTGLQLARSAKAPFVLEYNGSEVWIQRHWGRGSLAHESLAVEIEEANLRASDLVVVVSQPLKDELVRRGVEADKVLVNPNGVDPERYSPSVDGASVRRQYGLEGKLVIGFIGTFGRWHGAEVLAEAFGKLVRDNPDYTDRLRLIMIGDGLTLPQVKERIAGWGVQELSIFTGTVPQEAGPAHLAACDVLVSPHVPNPDGSAFFGSPTKLFEYMAMGKGIVASNLGQIGEVLTHRETAWLVPPGDSEALQEGLKQLLDQYELRLDLGRRARLAAVSHFTWRAHTERIVARLSEIMQDVGR